MYVYVVRVCVCVVHVYVFMYACVHVQVLSNTFSKTMETMGKAETEETAKFVQILGVFEYQ